MYDVRTHLRDASDIERLRSALEDDGERTLINVHAPPSLINRAGVPEFFNRMLDIRLGEVDE